MRQRNRLNFQISRKSVVFLIEIRWGLLLKKDLLIFQKHHPLGVMEKYDNSWNKYNRIREAEKST